MNLSLILFSQNGDRESPVPTRTDTDGFLPPSVGHALPSVGEQDSRGPTKLYAAKDTYCGGRRAHPGTEPTTVTTQMLTEWHTSHVAAVWPSLSPATLWTPKPTPASEFPLCPRGPLPPGMLRGTRLSPAVAKVVYNHKVSLEKSSSFTGHIKY